MISSLRNSYEKNWPEIYAGLTGSLPDFIFARRPDNVDLDIPVFCYHTFDEAEFRADLEFLRANRYVTLDADSLVSHLLNKELAPPRSVVLSVDDGSRNLFDVGYPLLKEYGMQAVAFIVPGFHEEDTESHFTGFVSRPCTWSELRTMQDSGYVDIQSHTFEHRYVPRWPEPIPLTGADPDLITSMLGESRSIEEDFLLSRTTIEDKLDKRVRHLCFVKYQGSAEAVEIGQKCGFESFWWGYLGRHSGNHPGQSPTRITRVEACYLRRLPGVGRIKLSEIFQERYGKSAGRLWRKLRGEHDKAASQSPY
jgi:peptidoglycan/xylan/chitin deacetylase (PgdA/CDA1 family)